jgi:hypothetical protein
MCLLMIIYRLHRVSWKFVSRKWKEIEDFISCIYHTYQNRSIAQVHINNLGTEIHLWQGLEDLFRIENLHPHLMRFSAVIRSFCNLLKSATHVNHHFVQLQPTMDSKTRDLLINPVVPENIRTLRLSFLTNPLVHNNKVCNSFPLMAWCIHTIRFLRGHTHKHPSFLVWAQESWRYQLGKDSYSIS